MKIIIMSLCLAFASFSANAEIKLENDAKILGKWKVVAEATGLDKEKKALNVTWVFEKNGTLVTSGEDTLGRTKQMEIPIKYSIENGLIKKQIAPGREKYEECAVQEITDKEMTLKCKFLYFFLTR